MARTLPARWLCILLWLALAAACTSYGHKTPSFRLPSAMPNVTTACGSQVAARSYAATEATQAFGFDMVKAGLLPIQVVFDNQGEDALRINPEQTFLVDDKGDVWPALSSEEAYKRVTESTDTARVAAGTAKGGLLGAATGAVVGAALGIITGSSVAEAIGKGAAAGGVIGSAAGGVSAYDSQEASTEISRDLRNNSLRNRPINPGEMAYGFIFFPAEAGHPGQLRLQLQEVKGGKAHNLRLSL
ncbi:MAG: hypothetical protein V2A77_07090 [Pseudomonadota bacterium]